MKNLRVVLFVFFILSGCATPYIGEEELLTDGKTWRVEFGGSTAVKGCAGIYTSTESCIKTMKEKIELRGYSLCGREPVSVRACSRSRFGNWVECLVQCE